MRIQTVAFDRALYWYQSGWRSFTSAPFAWVGITLLYYVILFPLFILPYIGGLIAILISPLLTAGMLIAAKTAREGGIVRVGQLFAAFKDEDIRSPLLLLGALSLGASAAISVVSAVLMSGSAAGSGLLGLRVMISYAFVAVVSIALALFIVYAVPLICFARVSIVGALSSSLRACLFNVAALTVYGLLSILFAILATLPAGLGLLIFVPVSVCALYASYDEIFVRSLEA